MRITLAGSAYHRSGGGIGAYNRFLARKLSERGHRVQVVTVESSPQQLPRNPYSFVHAPEPATTREEPQWARRLFDAIVEFDPDVIVGSDHSTVISLFPSFAQRRICLTIAHSSQGTNAKTAAICPDHTDRIVAISYAGKDYLAGYIGKPYDGLTVLYNSLDDVADPGAVVARKAEQETVILCYPGGSSWVKNPKLFYEVARHFAYRRGLSITWSGDARHFRDRFAPSSSVHFSGQVPATDSQQLIAAAHIFVLCSRWEGCPMSLLEAMRTGAVPVVSDCPSAMRELVRDGHNGFVIDGNKASGYIAAIERLLADPELMVRLMYASRQTFAQRLDPEAYADAFERLCTPRPGCKRPVRDTFSREHLLRWQRRPGRWYKPTISYLCQRFHVLDRRAL